MVLIFALNCRFYAKDKTVRSSFEADAAQFKSELASAESSLETLAAALETIDENEKLSSDEYIGYLDRLPMRYLKKGSENAGYYYVMETADGARFKYYSLFDSMTKEISLRHINDIFKNDTPLPYKWSYIRGEYDNTQKAALVYTVPLKRENENIGYISIVLNMYFVEKSVFGRDSSYENIYLLDNSSDFIYDGSDESIKTIDSAGENSDLLRRAKDDARDKIKSLEKGSRSLLYTRLNDEIILVKQADILKGTMTGSFAVGFVGLSLILCFILLGVVHEKGGRILIFAMERYTPKLKQDDDAAVEPKYGNQLMLAVLLVFSAVMCFCYSLFSGITLLPALMLSALGAAVFIKLNLNRENEFNQSINERLARLVDGIIVALPCIFLFLSVGGGGECVVSVFLFSVFIYFTDVFQQNIQSSIRAYYAMISSMLIGQLAAMAVWKTPISSNMLIFNAFAAFVGLAIIVFFIVYKGHTQKHSKNMQALIDKVRDTQSMLIQNERMSTLGRLMAGISHEINTPLGAIKASADSFNTKLVDSLRQMTDTVGSFDGDDINAMFKLIELSFESVRKMFTTSELRKGRESIYELLMEEGFDDDRAYTVAYMLSRIEICEPDRVLENIDIFKRDNIEEILKLVCDLFFLVTGTNTIQLATNKVSKIMFALRAYSNVSLSNVKSEFNIIECIENILTLYTSQYNSAITINRFYEKEIPLLLGNSEGLGQVFTNLIQNAFYAVKDGGSLNITVKTQGDNVIIDFTDTGCGISEENLDRIFEPLFTTKSLGEGSGLGLGICRKIIEEHNGTITVKSRQGEGSSFTVCLPISLNTATDREE